MYKLKIFLYPILVLSFIALAPNPAFADCHCQAQCGELNDCRDVYCHRTESGCADEMHGIKTVSSTNTSLLAAWKDLAYSCYTGGSLFHSYSLQGGCISMQAATIATSCACEPIPPPAPECPKPDTAPAKKALGEKVDFDGEAKSVAVDAEDFFERLRSRTPAK